MDNTDPSSNGYVYLYGSPSTYVAGNGRDFYTGAIADGGSGIDKVYFYIDGVHKITDSRTILSGNRTGRSPGEVDQGIGD